MERELIEKYLSAKKTHAEAERAEIDANIALDLAKNELIDYLEENDLESTAAHLGLGRVIWQKPTLYPSIKEESKESVYSWLKNNGYAESIKETINAQTFGAIIRQRIDSGEEIPEGVDTSYYKRNLKFIPTKE